VSRRALRSRFPAPSHRGLLALGAALLACAPGPDPPRDLLLVSIDTLRADRLGSYGREDAGTPTLDGLAARGTRFLDAMAPTPVTLPSHATLFTGRSPLHHRVRHNGLFALPAAAVTLAERAGAAGFRTAGFVASIVLAERYGVAQGFEAYRSPGPGAGAELFHLGERPAPEVNRDALAWLDSIGESRFLLFVHYMEPHAPFRPPEPERSRFPGDPYQAEVSAADRALGELLAGLAERGRLERTLIAVAGDHGEALGDHGELSHGLLLYQPTLRIPLIFAGPGVMAGRAVVAPVGLVDVMPTLLDAIRLEPGSSDGRSLWPVLTGGLPPAGRSLYAESFVPRYDYGWSELRVLRRGSWKYVQAPRPELYDLREDPAEAHNLVAARPEEARAMARELAASVAASDARGGQARRIEPDPEEREALERLGYLSGAGPRPGSGAPAPDPKDRIELISALEWASRRIQERRPDEAEPVLRELVARNPAAVEIRLRLVTALELLGRRGEAEAEARQLIEVARELPHAERVAARAHVVLGDLYRLEDRPEAAVREYERALVTPQPTRVLEQLAALYADLGRPDDARRVLALLDPREDTAGRAREDTAARAREQRGALVAADAPSPAP
jgi:arylsulfatase A-like enzyme